MIVPNSRRIESRDSDNSILCSGFGWFKIIVETIIIIVCHYIEYWESNKKLTESQNYKELMRWNMILTCLREKKTTEKMMEKNHFALFRRNVLNNEHWLTT